MTHTLRIAGAALLATVGASQPVAAQLPAALAARIDSTVQVELVAKGATSVSLAIARADGSIYLRTWGLADIDENRLADTLTTYPLASMSKHITAALVLKLVDRGVLTLDDSIGQHLPGLKPEWNGRRIAQLLNHTAGLPREVRSTQGIDQPTTTAALLAQAAQSTAATGAAGARFGYSNTGYILLGALVERLYQKPYGEVLRDEITRPLGLASMRWCGDTETAQRAKGYMRSPDGKLTPAPILHPTQNLGHGVCSNAADIARWTRALHGGRVLSPAMYTAMTTPQGAAAVNVVPYGFGMYVRPTASGGTVFLTDGLTAGFATENVWYPTERISVTLLVNTLGVMNANSNIVEKLGALLR